MTTTPKFPLALRDGTPIRMAEEWSPVRSHFVAYTREGKRMLVHPRQVTGL